ncbi:resolvase [Streptomyces sp. AD2-2]|nr:resolvase [Streptomyces sp. AD2-2]
MRVPYLEGRSIAALARDHGVSRGGIRTSVADLMPDHTAADPDATAPELPVALDMPGKVADFLHTTELRPAERAPLDQGVTVRRGHGYTPRVTAVPAVHHRLPARRMAAPALRQSRPSARPAASTRTASAPSRRGHDRSHRDFLYPD